MLKRKIEAIFEKFYTDSFQKALLLTGARQVGKTYSVRKFGRERYESFVEINFIKNPDACSIFKNVWQKED